MPRDENSGKPPVQSTQLGYLKPEPAQRRDSIEEMDTIAAVSPGPSGATAKLWGGDGSGQTVATKEGATLVRGTVLPSLKMVGDETHLVTETRDRYQEEEALGAGGFGEVVSARDHDIDRQVAIKRLLPDMQFPEVISRFVDEIRTVGRLEHPNIVPIHDVGVDERGRYFFVMKHLEGETLEAIIEKLAQGNKLYALRFTFERRVQIFQGILEAVHYAHSRGIVHRDIKPANIMVGHYGEVVVMDWGIAKRAGVTDSPRGEADPASPHTLDGTLLGTPPYMSPEQALGRNDEIDARSDVYSLCVLFYELLALRHYLSDRKSLDDVLDGVINLTPPTPTTLRNPHQTPVPADLGWFVLKGLQKDPGARYQSVEEMITRLEKRADGHIPVQCPLTLTKAATNTWIRFVDRHPNLYMVTMAMIVLGALGLGGFKLLTALGVI